MDKSRMARFLAHPVVMYCVMIVLVWFVYQLIKLCIIVNQALVLDMVTAMLNVAHYVALCVTSLTTL